MDRGNCIFDIWDFKNIEYDINGMKVANMISYILRGEGHAVRKVYIAKSYNFAYKYEDENHPYPQIKKLTEKSIR